MSQIQIWLAQRTAKFKDGFISAENASPVAGLDLPLSLMWKRVVYDADPSLVSCMEYFTRCREFALREILYRATKYSILAERIV